MNKIGVIILAAGNSSRLGRPKQLLLYRGQTLLTHVVAEALAADLRPVVVTGAYHTEVSDSLRGQSVDIVFNPAWEEGMGSGIVAGLSNMLLLHPDMEAVIITVCDQPFISAALLLQLVNTFDTSGKGMIACTYADSVGTPVLFGRAWFERLLGLSGSEGAKKLLKLYPDDLATVDFPGGEIDIDTGEDVSRLGDSINYSLSDPALKIRERKE
jgi:molybdenum cofactor cytidylyltransferase